MYMNIFFYFLIYIYILGCACGQVVHYGTYDTIYTYNKNSYTNSITSSLEHITLTTLLLLLQ